MFERLQKPFLTVETGEAYQPVRLSYVVRDQKKSQLIDILNEIQCIKQSGTTWSWFWNHECADLHFESLDSFRKDSQKEIRLGTLTLRDNYLYIHLPSFKRACLATSFFHRTLTAMEITVHHADFINKVYGIDERLPHGFTELFKDDELEHILKQRALDYEKIKEKCEQATSGEEALTILSDYSKKEAQKRLPFAERYIFNLENKDSEIVYLAFYVFLRSRELVAIKRWFGETGYSLSEVADEMVEAVFGSVGLDSLDDFSGKPF